MTAPGVVTLVWFHQSGLTTGMLATATYANGVLSPSLDVAAAPSNGMLFDVVPGPDGQLWAVTRNDSGTGQNLQVRAGLAGVPQTTHRAVAGRPSVAGLRRQQADRDRVPGGLHLRRRSTTRPGAVHTFQPIPKTWSLGVFPMSSAPRRVSG